MSREAISEARLDLWQRLRWTKRLRVVSLVSLVGPLIAFAVVFALAVATSKGPDSGFFILGLLFQGAMWSPMLLVPLIAWRVFARRSRLLQQRLDCLPTITDESLDK